jgi:D-sedoheptulose 7-phosphate isomerase
MQRICFIGECASAMAILTGTAPLVAERFGARNELVRAFFTHEAPKLALVCREMAARFLRGGRLLAFGRGPYATDAQHVAVEFVHPVIVGKRALPATDISLEFGAWLDALAGPDDIAMGFGPPSGDEEVTRALNRAARQGVMTLALPGTEGSYPMPVVTADPFIHQELIEVLYHTLWETVHVFFERREHGFDTLGEVARSIRAKAEDDIHLRDRVAAEQGEDFHEAADMMATRLGRGGKLLLFGNGGSATDANDWAIDCVLPPPGFKAVAAFSLSLEPATVTAIANDVGAELTFLRQIIAHAARGDVAVAISTSGRSRNIVAALEEARRRGLAAIALLGHDGGEVLQRGLADVSLLVPCDHIPRIQEVHASIYHVLREAIDRQWCGGEENQAD